MGSIKNLLIVGRTNCGKSALGNVLCNETCFEENESTFRNSKDFQEDKFRWNETEYRVVDMRIRSNDKNYLINRLCQVIYSMPEGISQVLFVIDERFTKEEIKTFKVFESTIFKTGIDKYTTIVRTKFENFKSKEECDNDKEDLCKAHKKISKLCKNIVYVDNPPTKICVNDEDDNDTIKFNKKRREKSRTILLSHLEKVCSNEYFKLNMWDKLNNSETPEEVERYIESEDKKLAKLFKSKKNLHCSPS
ncbi:hypothetical protein C1645_217450 [Glomus cerebriforme]|uniref:AIG1-type G domain-containing protein n=1 Tax=Glomus cerebriforme TaxID=658196 RepID=A0A397SYV6_9GLOM|nr:hypothetical protein C1645_217450 [Glomus cerebriforme]